MKQETLKYLRVLIPGLLVLVGCIPFFELVTPSIMKELPFIKLSYISLVSILIGSIYYQLDVSKLVTNFSFKIFGGNINKGILKIYNEPLNKEEKKYLSNHKNIRNVFYNLVDNDNSLSIRSKNIYFNGIFWTSSADAFIISIIFIIIYSLSGIKNAEEIRVIFSYTAGIALLLHIITVNKHVKLQVDQLDYIETNYYNEVKTKLNELLHKMP